MNDEITAVIAEDDPQQRLMLSMYLPRKGIKLLQVSTNANDLAESVKNYNPQLIISDNDMPLDNQGMETILALRREGYQMPAIIASGRSQQIPGEYSRFKWKNEKFGNTYLHIPDTEELGRFVLVSKPYTLENMVQLAKGLVA